MNRSTNRERMMMELAQSQCWRQIQPLGVLSYRQNPRASGPITASEEHHEAAWNRRAERPTSPYRAGADTEDRRLQADERTQNRLQPQAEPVKTQRHSKRGYADG